MTEEVVTTVSDSITFDQANTIIDLLTWLTGGVFALLGAVVLIGFWQGWRSTK